MMANILAEGASESSTSELMSVLNLLGNDKLEDNVNHIILGLVASLSVDTSPDIKALNILNTVLKLKYKLRDDGAAAGESLLDCRNICNLCLLLMDRNRDIKDQCFNSLCSILQHTLLLMGKDSFYSCVTNVVTKCQQDLTFMKNADIEESKYACTRRPEVSLRILETVCAAVLHKQDSNALNTYETEKNRLAVDDMYNLILSIFSCGVEHISIQTLQSVISKVLMCTTDKNLLQKLWKHIATNVDSDLSHTFQILCILIQFYLPSGLQNVHMSYDVTKENVFWKMLQSGLTSVDSLVRKRALYLMKRAVDSICQNCTSLSFHYPDAVFWWDPTDSSKVWEQFFLVIETLEEKQVHIIKPVLTVVDFLCASYNKSNIPHVSWMICIFCRIVSHDSISVVKWGIINFVRIHRELHLARNGCRILEFLSPFMNAVNNSALYSVNSEHSSLSEVGEALKDLFESVITESSHEDCRAFFCYVVDVMNSISWAPVPLLNVIYALAHTPSVPVWDKQRLGSLKDFVAEVLRCQCRFIRGAVQCMLLRATIHFADSDSLDIYTVAGYLGSFRGSESLKRGTSAWHHTVEWIQVFISKDNAARFVTTTLSAPEDGVCISTRAVARMVVLLCDASLLPCCMIDNTCSLARSLYSVLSCFHDCDKRLYASEVEQNHSLELVVCLLSESHTVCEDDFVRKTVTSYVNSVLDQIFIFISRRMLSVIHLQDYYVVNSYITALCSFADEVGLMSRVKANLSKLQDTALEVLGSSAASPMSHYFSMRVLSCISHWFRKHCHCTCDASGPCVVLERQSVLMNHVFQKGRLNSPPVKRDAELKLTRDLQTLWGRLISGYLEAGWSIVAHFLHSCLKAENLVLSLRSIEDVVGDVTRALEIGGRSTLIPVMNVLEKILPRCVVSETLKLISVCWSMIFEVRKTELFWTSMEAFIQMLFQPSVMATATYQDHLLQYSRKIFSHGEAVAGLCNILTTQLQKAVALSSPDILEQYCSLLVEALTFGPVHRRDQRIITDTCRFISSLGEKCSINALASNDCSVDNEVRARAVQLLLAACGSSLRHQIVGKLMEALVLKDKAESSHKTRYYGDSQLHRLKHRVMQSLLILEPLLDMEMAERLVQWLQDSLLMESQQPSVRYQQEWLLTRLLYHHSYLRDRIWDMFHHARQKRPGSICSFIAVLYQVACALIDEQDVFVDRSVREILPWCMAQHFSVRLYAQTALQKLFALCKVHHHDRVSEKYTVVEMSLQTSMDHCNTVKSVHFYFSAFHPNEHYTLETIFYDLPRLAGVTCEEWVSCDLLRSCGVSGVSHIDLVNSDCALKQFSAAAWMPKSSAGTEDDVAPMIGLHKNVQKKLVPWRAMIPDQNLASELKQKRAEGLIVVASLINCLPNLGGLSRTCEVFGVSEYIVGTLKSTEDKQFRSLSVTAEQWIPISEVKPHLLPRYLEAKKKDGYMLVGAEQTANSTRLNDFKFTQKTLLLLGNEREGIPADLLPFLDVCVEIPQQGVVRSLNVHVTGALFVWEYMRQQALT